jgi:hypothetical protein
MNTCVEKNGDGLQIDYHKVAHSADPLSASFIFWVTDPPITLMHETGK